MPSRYAKHGLSILLQHRLVYYHISQSDDQTYFQVHLRHTYDIVRYGKITSIVKERLHKAAADLVAELQRDGYASSNDLLLEEIAHGTDSGQDGDNGQVNGHTLVNGTGSHGKSKYKDGPSENKRKRLATCKALFDARYVVEVTEHDLIPPADFHDMVAQQVKNAEFNGEVKGKKDTELYTLRVLKRKREMLDENTAFVHQLEEAARIEKESATNNNSRKRHRDNEGNGHDAANDQLDGISDSRPNKKRKAHGDDVEDGIEVIHEGGSDVSKSVLYHEPRTPTYRINNDKFHVSLRSQWLTKLAARHLGETVAQVYGILLSRMEKHIDRCHDEYTEALKAKKNNRTEEGDDVGYDDDDEDIAVTTWDVAEHLGPSADLLSTFSAEKNAKVKVEAAQENGETHHDGDDEDVVGHGAKTKSGAGSLREREERIMAIDRHLKLASEHFLHFCQPASGRGSRNWTVKFHDITRALVQFELESVITSRFGPLATRVVRMLHDKGKLDEKQLSSIGLIRQKELRLVLTQMQEAGFVDTQEIPRDTSRQPSRTIYLWFYDYDRCRTLVLEDTYKSMTRLLQRAKVEQERVQSVLDKAERTDVQGQEDKYLTDAEQQALAEWRKTQEQLLVQVARQDELVGLLRDYLPVKS